MKSMRNNSKTRKRARVASNNKSRNAKRAKMNNNSYSTGRIPVLNDLDMPESSEFLEPMPASHRLTNMVGTIMPNNSHMMPYAESNTYNPFNSNNEQAGGKRRKRSRHRRSRHRRRATKKRSSHRRKSSKRKSNKRSSHRRKSSKRSATQKRRI